MNAKGFVHKYGDNVDTDVIIPARYLNIADKKELATHCMEDIDKHFVDVVKAGDVMVGGFNFGCGSSREHAPMVIKESGISCVIAKTFARIFYRNSINIGLAILECPEASDRIRAGDEVAVDFDTGLIENLTRGERYQAEPFPPFIKEIINHNGLMNALAAASAAYVLGIRGEAVERGLATFTGAGRRFEKKGSYHGADVYDDYAHHPGELHALLTMAKALPYRRIVCAFQPHTYTRTKALFEEFVRELKLPDVLILAEIYAAREQNDIGISSNDLARRIPGAIYCPTLDKVTEALRAAAQPGDLIITVGAGDIYKAGEKLLREN